MDETLIAVFGSLAGVLVGIGGMQIAERSRQRYLDRTRHDERRHNRDLLLSAFLAEAQVNALMLRAAAIAAGEVLDSGVLPTPLVGHMRPKTDVFDANLNRLGELRSPKLTEHLALTYSQYNYAETMAEHWREQPEGDAKTGAILRYCDTVTSAGRCTTLLRAMLEASTAHLKTPRELEEGLIPESVQKELLIFSRLRDRLGSVEGDRGEQ